ncbi:MAG: sugar ABC transporter ATP-binding protein [Clostridiales bacterium]|nr:sugar ABC transporter ATP-binding protein [Clostridiales bacterium]
MLKVSNITKTFPGVKALSEVTCEFERGEIHALLGENGAGKSTLIKIICGVYRKDEGCINIDGQDVEFKSFEDALKYGISIVNQEIQVIPLASVAENVMLDKIANYTKSGKLNWKKLNQDAAVYLDMLGLNLPPETPAGELSPAQKQMVSIARALSSDAKYLLLDEPTSSLTYNEANILFEQLYKLKERNIGLIFISHKLEEVLEICDRLTVLRDGKVIGTRSCEGLKKEEIVEMMIGRSSNMAYLGQSEACHGTPTLSVRGLCQQGRFEDVSFDAYPGEILGFYGLVGSGRTELARAIIGDTRVDKAEIYVKGKKANITSIPNAVNKYGIGYVSENRKEEGLILGFDIVQNTSITIWRMLKKTLFSPINIRKEIDSVQRVVDQLSIKTPSLSQLVLNLSGGNQQKVSIGKWLACGNDILFIDEPTVGVDVGAKEYIHQLIWDLATKEKKTIILISSDMPEMIKLARRIMIFRDSKIIATIGCDELDTPPPGPSYEYVSGRIGEYLL